ncbi:MAG: hypothetical protein AB9907_10240 [Flexilinea sp.]
MLEDVWVSTAKKDEANAEESIRKLPESNPYKNKYDENVQKCSDCEKCAVVLDKK